MSTFGREADRIAAAARKQERQLAEKRILLSDAVAFAIVTLKDKSIPDAAARKTALGALEIGRSA
jgi:hypothetical protein